MSQRQSTMNFDIKVDPPQIFIIKIIWQMAKGNGTRKFVIAFLTFWMYATENGQIKREHQIRLSVIKEIK